MKNKLIDNSNLIKQRAALTAEEDLMRGGVHVEPDTGKSYFTGYDYKRLYDWDQYFEAIIQIYMGWDSEYIENAVTIFLDHQQESGLVSRSVSSTEFHDPEHVKPFLAQTSLLVVRYFDEKDWLLNEEYYPRLKRYIDYWIEEMDSTGNGLSEWMSAPHTGMDNQHERAGHWLDRISKGVDLNCYLYRDILAFASLAELAGHSEDAAVYRGKAEKLAEKIRTLLWDDEDGFFYDMHVKTGELIKVRAVSGFMPMWAGIATPEQAKRLVNEYLFNSEEFWTAYPVTTLSKSEKGYSAIGLPDDVMGAESCSWRANTWIPTNYMVYHGLKNYGYDQLASLLANATTKLIAKAGNREWYDTDTGNGRGLNPFWGWSLLGHFMDFEEQTGENPTVI